MILALTGGQKLGLALVAGLFIAFALASSFVFPRMNPDFPGQRRLRLFLAVCAAFFVAMMTAMVVLASETEAPEGEQSTEAAQVEGGTTEAGPTESEPAAAQGDPVAGKAVFESAGCTACHTLADAGSTGTVGPNLDEAMPDHDLVVERVTNGMGAMPSFSDSLSDEDIENVATYVSQAAGGSS